MCALAMDDERYFFFSLKYGGSSAEARRKHGRGFTTTSTDRDRKLNGGTIMDLWRTTDKGCRGKKKALSEG